MLRRRLSAHLIVGMAALTVGACSERYIASQGERSLVVVEDVIAAGPSSAARAIYIVPEDRRRPLTGKSPIARMHDHLEFDCATGRVASRGQRLILEDGEILDMPTATLDWSAPPAASVSAAVLGVVCDPAKGRAAATRRPLDMIIREYRSRYG